MKKIPDCFGTAKTGYCCFSTKHFSAMFTYFVDRKIGTHIIINQPIFLLDKPAKKWKKRFCTLNNEHF